MLDSSALEETDLRDGKPVKVTRWSVGAGGNTIHARFDDLHDHVQVPDGRKVT